MQELATVAQTNTVPDSAKTKIAEALPICIARAKQLAK
jgi:hypothetical protein